DRQISGADRADGTRADKERDASDRLPFNDNGKRNGINQRHAQTLRGHGGKRANADAEQHRQQNLELEQIQKSLGGRAKERNFHAKFLPRLLLPCYTLPHSVGSGPAPANFLNSSTVSGSRGKSRIARSFSSGNSGVGSSPTTLLYSLTKSGSLKALRNPSLMISARSLGVAGGRMNGEPESRNSRNIESSLRVRSFFANVSTSGNLENSGCFSPLGISMTM